MFTIGEFSKITGLTVKTLRFYHEQEILVPTYIDDQSGYRYYNEAKVESARVITQLKKLGFSVREISTILQNYHDDADILEFLESQRDSILQKLHEYKTIEASLDQIISHEKEARVTMQKSDYQLEEKVLKPQLIAAVRMKAAYSDCGKGFSQIGKKLGRHICGKPFLLHYDTQYEEIADYEACMPVRKGESTKDISVRELPGGKCVSLVHQGPYDELSRSYEKIQSYINKAGYSIEVPSREVYLKGPGMIFRGNPKKYLTEIQMMISDSSD